uniref:Uncharacterized protein n=1 Tax=Picea glauca TaxID=3330 RepID=A0A101LXH1_PICGL|nr:hypothetical protein ABT39_MTgene6177 [Picea glauca]QHR88685.1 hypothetical protein Q903MT_gene2699 [Picea sitchensis]
MLCVLPIVLLSTLSFHWHPCSMHLLFIVLNWASSELQLWVCGMQGLRWKLILAPFGIIAVWVPAELQLHQ